MNKLKEFTDDKVFMPYELVRAYYHNENCAATPLHTHNFYELNVIISGHGKHFVNNSSFHVANGDVFIMPPGINHGYSFDSPTYSIFHLLFHKQFFKKYEKHLTKLTGYQILFNIEPLIRTQEKSTNQFLHINIAENYNLTRIFNELTFLEHEGKENSEPKKEYLTLYVIAKICDMIEEEKVTYNGNKRYLYDLLKSVEYIHSNFGMKIELETLYSISCMSRSSYLRYFKQLFNCTPSEYLQDFRLKQAKSMLKHSNNSLAYIASDCGFCDSAHLSRLFKEKYHMPPSQYRILAKSSTETKTKDISSSAYF